MTDSSSPNVAALHHLTGKSGSGTSWLSQSEHFVALAWDKSVQLLNPAPGEVPANCLANLHRTANTYLVRPCGSHALWVNGDRVQERQLVHGDVVEFGESGPISRFEIVDDDHPLRRTLPDILQDTVAYLRISRKPLGVRLIRGLGTMTRELVYRTSLLFRAFTVGGLLLVAALALRQGQEISELERDIAASQQRLDVVAVSLATAREDTLRPGELAELRELVEMRIAANEARLADLEASTEAGARVVAEALHAVLFLQGAFGLRDTETGNMLRFAADDTGRLLMSPFGQPQVTLDGDGPLVQREFTGTAFAIESSPHLVTNRHIALPWEQDAASVTAAMEGLEPVMIRLLGYFPGKSDPVGLEVAAVSDNVDLALLRPADPLPASGRLRLAEGMPVPGQEVIVLGYATGLRALLARSDQAFLERLERDGEVGFWDVAARLSEAGLIKPLASRGIVAQTTGTNILFDAETTRGGSGGPVLDLDGRVIAIQAAVLRDFGGSNIAISAAALADLIEDH